MSEINKCRTVVVVETVRHIHYNMAPTARARLSRACRGRAGKCNAGQAMRQTPLLFRQIGDQLGVADCQRKLKLVFQSGFLQHIRHMEFDR